MGHKTLIDARIPDTGLDDLLDELNRLQGESVLNEVKALVANLVEMTGISVNKIRRAKAEII